MNYNLRLYQWLNLDGNGWYTLDVNEWYSMHVITWPIFMLFCTFFKQIFLKSMLYSWISYNISCILSLNTLKFFCFLLMEVRNFKITRFQKSQF